jgi:NitT/TauT family transport system substrate-binding protein
MSIIKNSSAAAASITLTAGYGLFVSIAFFLVGCDQSSPSSTTPATNRSSAGAHTAAGTQLSELRLGYFPNLTHAQAVLEVSSGDLAKALGTETKLSTKIFNAGPSAIEALLARQIDVTYVGPSPVLNAWLVTKGQDIVVIAGAAANGVVIVASKDSGITTLEQLKGKRVATPAQGNTQDISARRYLKITLGQSDLNNVIPIANAEQVAMMGRGQIDASWAPEPWGSLLVSEAGGTVIGHENDLWPEKQFILTVIATTPEFLRAHPDVVEKLLGVHRAWTSRLKADPSAYTKQLGDALVDLTKKKLPTGVLSAAIQNVQFTDEPIEASFKTFDQWSFDLGFTKKPSDLTGLVDATILRKLQQQQPAEATTTQSH